MRRSYWMIAIAALLALTLVVACGPKKTKPTIVEETLPTPAPTETQPAQPTPTPTGWGETATTTPTEEGDDPYNLRAVYFDFDRYDLRPEAQASLNRYAQVLRKNADIKLRLEGHCDERDTEEYNLALGDRRANAVYRYLVDLGVAASRLTPISYGEAYPADPGHNEAAWALNRRVEFKAVR